MDEDEDNPIIPAEGVVDDTNTLEGQLTAFPGHTFSQHTLLQLKKYLSDTQYPASLDELYTSAERQGAGQDVLDVITGLQQGLYKSFGELSQEVIAHA